MASIMRTELYDDRDGGPADEADIPFSLDGIDYVIDLSKENASALRRALDPWIDCARRVGRTPRKRGTGSPRLPRTMSAQIREWAKEQGCPVSDRGRIPLDVVERYTQAMQAAS
jgi:hypothetical protein